MSFSSEVKQEIAHVELNDCCTKAELYAFIQLKSSWKLSKGVWMLEFQTTSNTIARRIAYLFFKAYQLKMEIRIKKRSKLDKKNLYWMQTKEKTIEILQDMEILGTGFSKNDYFPTRLFANDCCKISFLRGAFLARGSINNPTSSKYHLEIVTEEGYLADAMLIMLEAIGVEAKVIVREKGNVIYTKRAESIGDFLRYIGAVNQLFLFEDARIKKDLSNYVNRIINCDLANEEKALKSAAKQLENIRYLQNKQQLLDLPQRLVDAIYLRSNYPDDSLSQLSERSEEVLGKYISKSGLSHCFRDIDKLVASYNEDKSIKGEKRDDT